MTNSINEVYGTEVFFIIGSNTTETHPVIGAKIKQAKAKGAKIIVAEPRRIEVAEQSDLFLQIKPGTNVALINGMLHVIIKENLHQPEFINAMTEEFEAMAKTVEKYTPEMVAEICGIKAKDLIAAARMYATAKTAAIYYAMGITQHSTGTEGVMSLSNLALTCGHIGKESTGINPLRGQNNVQGACDMGGLPSDFPGYQKVFNPDAVAKFEKAWNCKLSDKVGLTATEIVGKAGDGEIKFLYIMGENPMVSDPDINHAKHCLEHTEFLVVQDIFLTETAELASVVLPACTFAEKDGTFSNTERRVQMVRKAIQPTGESKADWQIIQELMTRFGYAQNFADANAVFAEMSELTPSYAGISHARLEQGSLQWPCPTKEHPGTKYLHREGKFSRGKGLFKAIDYKPSAELPDAEYPLILTTGRVLYHYHTRTMTGKSEGINNLCPESFVEMNPLTAAKQGFKDGEMISITSRRGKISTKAVVTDKIEEGVLFMPFHFQETNMLTNAALDPLCKIPEFKVCAVKTAKI